MTRLVRRSSATSRGTAFFSLSNIPSAHAQMFWLSDTYHTKKRCWFLQGIDIFSWLYRHKRRCKNRASLVFWRQRWENVSCRLGRLKCFFAKLAVHEWSCLYGLSVDEFQDLPIQFRQLLGAKNFNGCGILLVGQGGPTLIKKVYEMRIGSSLVTEWQNYPGFFWAWTRQLEKHETGPHQMVEAWPEEKVRRKFLADTKEYPWCVLLM